MTRASQYLFPLLWMGLIFLMSACASKQEVPKIQFSDAPSKLAPSQYRGGQSSTHQELSSGHFLSADRQNLSQGINKLTEERQRRTEERARLAAITAQNPEPKMASVTLYRCKKCGAEEFRSGDNENISPGGHCPKEDLWLLFGHSWERKKIMAK